MPALENRVPPPIVATLVGALMWGASLYLPAVGLPTALRLGLALLLAAAGITFALAGVLSFRRARTTVNPLKPETASSLVTGGIYRVSRNPMYVGMALALTGWAAWLALPPALFGPLLFVLYIDRFQIAPEERAMEQLFGDTFRAYRARVRRWL